MLPLDVSTLTLTPSPSLSASYLQTPTLAWLRGSVVGSASSSTPMKVPGTVLQLRRAALRPFAPPQATIPTIEVSFPRPDLPILCNKLTHRAYLFQAVRRLHASPARREDGEGVGEVHHNVSLPRPHIKPARRACPDRCRTSSTFAGLHSLHPELVSVPSRLQSVSGDLRRLLLDHQGNSDGRRRVDQSERSRFDTPLTVANSAHRARQGAGSLY